MPWRAWSKGEPTSMPCQGTPDTAMPVAAAMTSKLPPNARVAEVRIAPRSPMPFPPIAADTSRGPTVRRALSDSSRVM